jgi:hypothetical protein
VKTPYRYLRLWQGLGIALIAAVVLGSLVNIAPTLPLEGGDKLHHLVAYGALMYWWGMTQPLRRWRWALALVMLGSVLEFAQSLTGTRFMEWQDALANACGVGLALLVLRSPASGLVGWLDRQLRNRLDARCA